MVLDNRDRSYMQSAFDPTSVLVNNFSRTVHANGRVRFDTLIGTGLSGALVVPVLARALHKNYMIVRKPGDDSHTGGRLHEGVLGDRFIFVDDFISTGATLRRVLGQVADRLRYEDFTSTFVGVYEYEPRNGHQRWTLPGDETRGVAIPPWESYL